YSRNYRPQCVKVETTSPGNAIDAVALAGNGGLTLCVVNRSKDNVETQLRMPDLDKEFANCAISQLIAGLDDVNTSAQPTRITPLQRIWNPKFGGDGERFTFDPWSVTVFSFEP